ncbi:MAG: type II toxin-antitoxin system VapC family toxin [Ktedonobacteraceae bacterium]|nr:type II toxin-antitoxin system VapC family toxin [Ktedonobacteraceae bacterium]
MRQYLLDSNVLGAYLQGRPGVLSLAQTWIHNDETATSIVVYGEIMEYLKGFAEFRRYQAALRTLLRKVHPDPLTYALLEQYADLRRAMRPPYGPGLIGDIDTLIAATALHYRLTLVTTDSDFMRVPDISLMHLPLQTLRG